MSGHFVATVSYRKCLEMYTEEKIGDSVLVLMTFSVAFLISPRHHESALVVGTRSAKDTGSRIF